jgi:serine/threonine protein kinase
LAEPELANTEFAGPAEAIRPPDASVLGGRYVLGPVLGSGGTSTVFQAQDGVLGRTVAVKVFRTDPTDLGHQARSKAEVQLLAGLSHPGLVTVFDAGTESRPYGPADGYLVMEYIGGPTLKRAITRGAVQPCDVAEVGAQLAEALAYVHAKGIIHRDIKPANILLVDPALSPDAHVVAKLSDFGIARLLDGTRMTMHGMTVGTANYLSPEQARGAEMDQASDIYSLGLVLLECLTGHLAYPGTGIEAAIARLHRPPAVPERLGPQWSALLTAMTSTDPDQRPTASQVAQALTPLRTVTAVDPDPSLTSLLEVASTDRLGPLPGLRWTEARVARAPTGAHRSRRRRPVIIALAVVSSLVIALLLLVLVTRGGSPSRTPNYPSVPGRLGTDLGNLQRSVQ